jgi:hypothetical protein
MNTNMFVLASRLSDPDLLARLCALAGTERETSAELVAHLAVLDARPSLYAAHGHGSLFSYCTRALRLSEDAACNRIDAARACQRFPVILDLLASGELSLASVRMLRPCLTPENHEAVLARARGRSRQDVLALIAELAPRPDVPSTVRKLPAARPTPGAASPSAPTPIAAADATAGTPDPSTIAAAEAPSTILTPLAPLRRPIVVPTSPDRYRVQFTIGKESHEKLHRLQALLRREIPNGDPGAIFDRAIALLLERVEQQKLGLTARPRPIRPGTDTVPSRHVPNQSKRVAWRRDGGQCAFVAPSGQRCEERAFVEFHHMEAHALGGPSTPDNISLRCRRHNQYEAEQVFGPRATPRRDG